MIEIDGSTFEGGGQMVRICIVLSQILEKECKMHSLRVNRNTPGANQVTVDVMKEFNQEIPKMGDLELFIKPVSNLTQKYVDGFRI